MRGWSGKGGRRGGRRGQRGGGIAPRGSRNQDIERMRRSISLESMIKLMLICESISDNDIEYRLEMIPLENQYLSTTGRLLKRRGSHQKGVIQQHNVSLSHT